MRVHEFQAKEILARFGLPVPQGQLAANAEEAGQVVEGFGGAGVVKAQIYAGGRGKAGGVKVVKSPEEAKAAFDLIHGRRLITPQTGPQGREVKQVFVEEMVDIKAEYYLSALIDRATARLTLLASTAGGMEIEEVAASQPEMILKRALDPIAGFTPYIARELGFGLGLEPAQLRGFTAFLASLVKAFQALDASLIEINPLVLTESGEWVAADAKATFDDSALFRHPDLAQLDDPNETDPLEWEARKHNLNYIKLDGDIGAMVNGAGLAMATMDLIEQAGAEPANFLDVGGGADKEMIAQGFRIILADPTVKAILINIFGGILRCDILAEGIVQAAREMEVDLPLIVRLAGTNAEAGREILDGSGLSFLVAEDMAEAARLVADRARGNE
ncbi:MAG: ADP-forming succinate--CoA ligase subunit beta [Deltaproteobacteria bacterium]|nr:ADP-forming succinate--CoA ligase subunit beta [Deltaproteobacteria bacterium]